MFALPQPMNRFTLLTTSLLALLILLQGTPTTLAGMPTGRTADDAVTPVENSRHSKFLEEIDKREGKIDLVLVGDSITDFWPGKGKDSYAQLKPWNPLNLGISAERTEQVLWRLQNGELDGFKAKAIMILIGTNNIGHHADEKPEWVAAGIRRILETIREKQPQAKVLLLAIFPRGATATDPQNQRVTETNKLLPALADEKTVFYMDIGGIFLDEQGNVKKELMPDFLHPNADGYTLWLAAVKPKLSEFMK